MTVHMIGAERRPFKSKGAKIVDCRLRFRCGCCAHCRLQSVFWTAPEARTRRDAMAIRWHADLARPQMGGAVGNSALHARGSAHYLAGFGLCPANRAWRRIGDRAVLGDSCSRTRIRFEDGGKGELALRQHGRPHRNGTSAPRSKSRLRGKVRFWHV